MIINALIPIRGGSKGIPKKNIKKLNGKMLFEYALDATKQCEFFENIIVSSDDNEIIDKVIDYRKDYGRILVDKRPKELAQDDSKSIDVAKYVLNTYGGDILVLINACCPLTQTQDIQNVVKMVLETKADSVVSLVEDFSCHPSKICYLDEKNKVYNDTEFETNERQKLDKYYKRNTAIYLATRRTIITIGTFFGEDTRGYVMPKERSLDINDMFDWKIAEFLIQNETSQK
ncbi:MAG: acylneuraminate cytidylyltransferase family protein [Nanoarchaeota archaeon]